MLPSCERGACIIIRASPPEYGRSAVRIWPRRSVAQSGSAPGLGPGGRRFESCLPDIKIKQTQYCKGFAFFYPKCVANGVAFIIKYQL